MTQASRARAAMCHMSFSEMVRGLLGGGIPPPLAWHVEFSAQPHRSLAWHLAGQLRRISARHPGRPMSSIARFKGLFSSGARWSIGGLNIRINGAPHAFRGASSSHATRALAKTQRKRTTDPVRNISVRIRVPRGPGVATSLPPTNDHGRV